MKLHKRQPCVVSIAGSDPSGGAGIQADIKTISATGCFAASIITALTAQNTRGVQGIHDIPAYFVREQLESVFNDLEINAVKIGMLHDEEIIESVASTLKIYQPKNIVLDPVMVSKNGCHLLKENTVNFLIEHLFSSCFLLTPNIFEAENILGTGISNLSAMEAAAENIGAHFNIHVLLKGGHLDSRQASDVLYDHQTKECLWFHSARVATRNTHGTGCSLSSAIASYLAQDYSLRQAVIAAKEYLSKAILSGSRFHWGEGFGPVDHFHQLRRDFT